MEKLNDTINKIRKVINKIGATKVGYVGCLLALVGVFLPVLRMSSSFGSVRQSETMSMFGEMTGRAWIMIVAIVIMAVLIFLEKSPKFTLFFTALVLGILTAGLAIPSEISSLVNIRWAFGAYITLLGLLGCLICGIFTEEKQTKKKKAA